jgi:hypothetical protein
MPFYTGKTKDGSDMQEVHGAYINPDNPNEWSSNPYPAQQRFMNMYEELSNYMNGRFSLRDVYNQIRLKECPLSKRCRDYVLSYFDEDGEFKY